MSASLSESSYRAPIIEHRSQRDHSRSSADSLKHEANSQDNFDLDTCAVYMDPRAYEITFSKPIVLLLSITSCLLGISWYRAVLYFISPSAFSKMKMYSWIYVVGLGAFVTIPVLYVSRRRARDRYRQGSIVFHRGLARRTKEFSKIVIRKCVDGLLGNGRFFFIYYFFRAMEQSLLKESRWYQKILLALVFFGVAVMYFLIFEKFLLKRLKGINKFMLIEFNSMNSGNFAYLVALLSEEAIVSVLGQAIIPHAPNVVIMWLTVSITTLITILLGFMRIRTIEGKDGNVISSRERALVFLTNGFLYVSAITLNNSIIATFRSISGKDLDQISRLSYSIYAIVITILCIIIALVLNYVLAHVKRNNYDWKSVRFTNRTSNGLMLAFGYVVACSWDNLLFKALSYVISMNLSYILFASLSTLASICLNLVCVQYYVNKHAPQMISSRSPSNSQRDPLLEPEA